MIESLVVGAAVVYGALRGNSTTAMITVAAGAAALVIISRRRYRRIPQRTQAVEKLRTGTVQLAQISYQYIVSCGTSEREERSRDLDRVGKSISCIDCVTGDILPIALATNGATGKAGRPSTGGSASSGLLQLVAPSFVDILAYLFSVTLIADIVERSGVGSPYRSVWEKRVLMCEPSMDAVAASCSMGYVCVVLESWGLGSTKDDRQYFLVRCFSDALGAEKLKWLSSSESHIEELASWNALSYKVSRLTIRGDSDQAEAAGSLAEDKVEADLAYLRTRIRFGSIASSGDDSPSMRKKLIHPSSEFFGLLDDDKTRLRKK